MKTSLFVWNSLVKNSSSSRKFCDIGIVHQNRPRSKLGTDCKAPSIAWNVPRPAMRQFFSVWAVKKWDHRSRNGRRGGHGGLEERPDGPTALRIADTIAFGNQPLGEPRRSATPFITGLAEPHVGSTEASPAKRFVT
jgi:hypothetical protein